MKLSGKFYKRSMTQVNVDIVDHRIGLVWIDKDKTQGVDWGSITTGDRVIFEVDEATFQELKGEDEQQGELFDEESELQDDSEE